MKKYLSIFLSIGLLIALLTGCGAASKTASNMEMVDYAADVAETPMAAEAASGAMDNGGSAADITLPESRKWNTCSFAGRRRTCKRCIQKRHRYRAGKAGSLERRKAARLRTLLNKRRRGHLSEHCCQESADCRKSFLYQRKKGQVTRRQPPRFAPDSRSNHAARPYGA